MMYVPNHFSWDDPSAIAGLMARYSFATLITGLQASHLPIRFDQPANRLVFHLARANPHCALLETGAESLAIFLGPHGYVSPRWYGSRDNVPTWNYQAVHVRGRPRPLDRAATIAELRRLADQFETGDDRWTLAELSERNLEKSLAALQAFELSITAIEAKAKLSQNRKAEDAAAVATAVEKDNPELAQAMRAIANPRSSA